MARKRSDVEGLDRVIERLEQAPGMHEVPPPAPRLPEGLPEPLIELYARCDGMRMFRGRVEIVRPTEVTMPTPAMWRFARIDGEPFAIDHRGRIWRADPALDDDVCDGTRLDRWLSGVYDAFALMFDQSSEALPAVREKRLRAQLRRDAGSPGVRWRLAHTLAEQGATEDARDMLEQVVSDDAAFTWAWLDLGRISEQLGDLGNAIDEIRMAAETADGVQHPHAGYFYAHLARIAERSGDEVARAQAATRASLLAPTLKQAQLARARAAQLTQDATAAKAAIELLRAVWPHDADVLAL